MAFTIKWGQVASKHRQLITLLLIIVFILSVIGFPILVSAKNWVQDSIACGLLKDHLLKKRILEVLNQTDLKLGDARTIAGILIKESRKHDIPISIFLAIMKKESDFNVCALSPVNAMGIMQIHPLTWDAYARKLNLTVSRRHAFDPVLNIKVAAALISDLKDRYLKKGYNENILWDYILSAYYAGGESLKKGLKKNHLYYVKKVREYEQEMKIII